MPQFPVSKMLCPGLILIAVGVLFLGGTTALLHYTNSTGFCTSCHSMQINLKEYRQSTHYKNTAGVRAGCADCHVPKNFFPMLASKTVALVDVYREIIGTIDTPDKFEARRWEMANRVWDKMKSNQSEACRSCHDYDSMKLDEQGKQASKKHRSAVERGKSCIECHSGIAHDEPLEPD